MARPNPTIEDRIVQLSTHLETQDGLGNLLACCALINLTMDPPERDPGQPIDSRLLENAAEMGEAIGRPGLDAEELRRIFDREDAEALEDWRDPVGQLILALWRARDHLERIKATVEEVLVRVEASVEDER